MDSYAVVSIVCPACGTELEPAEDVCHQCGATTSSDDSRSRLIDRPWLLVLVLLNVGLLGIPLYWKTKYSTGVRLGISAASIAYTVFAVAGIVWGGMYIMKAFGQLY